MVVHLVVFWDVGRSGAQNWDVGRSRSQFCERRSQSGKNCERLRPNFQKNQDFLKIFQIQ